MNAILHNCARCIYNDLYNGKIVINDEYINYSNKVSH